MNAERAIEIVQAFADLSAVVTGSRDVPVQRRAVLGGLFPCQQSDTVHALHLALAFYGDFLADSVVNRSNPS